MSVENSSESQDSVENPTRAGERPQEPRTSSDVGNAARPVFAPYGATSSLTCAQKEALGQVYLLCWKRHGGLQYIGMSQDVDRRINAHRKAGRLPFTQLGDPAIEVLHFGLGVYSACDA